jgi:hypothetical protein
MREPDRLDHGEDLPLWDFGLNLAVPEDPDQVPLWRLDVEAIAGTLARLTTETGRSFVIGIADVRRGVAHDCFFVAGPDLDLNQLDRALSARARWSE